MSEALTNMTFSPTAPPFNFTQTPTFTPAATAAASGGPNMGFLEMLNGVLPYVGMVVVGIVALCVFVWYTRKHMPPIARELTKAYHKPGLPAFIQDEMGNVGLYIANKKLPEGVISIPGKGWFLPVELRFVLAA